MRCLSKRADAIVKLGGLLRTNPHVIGIDEQAMSPDYTSRAQKFSSEDLDAKHIATLVDELRTKSEQLNDREKQIREMGYSLD